MEETDMEIITTIHEMQDRIRKLKLSGKSIGFVPTMGYLHEGHMQLLKEARKQNDIVVLSIFVNPLQFGPNEDFDTYPRDFERDKKIAESLEVDILFYPDKNEMYKNAMSVTVVVHERTNVLCGQKRPGHFDGVATVLTKLFNIVQPDRAYFGMKDAQQVAVVSGLIEDFNFPIELIPVETVREEDGLAKSSRNVNLTEQERKEAPAIYESLCLAKEAIAKGERSPAKIREMIIHHLESKISGTIDYVEIYSYPDLKPLSTLSGKIIVAIAVKFTKARLIDNITVEIF
jgi:pantoate--beta-alanine ligase